MKIRIIGGSGSGKTYISKLLNDKYNIKVYDLDEIEWNKSNNNYNKKNSIPVRKNKLKAIANRKNWIIEGVYYNWCEESFDKADYIFYLKTPLIIQQFRIIRRSIRRKLKIEKSMLNESLKNVIDLLKWNRDYNKNQINIVNKMLEPYEDKTFYVKNIKEIIIHIKEE